MAYRVNVQFKDGWAPVCDVLAEVTPRRGDIIAVTRHGRPVSVQVTAIWTPSSKMRGDGLVTVEAREV